jgi:hypothetical protein
MAMPSMAIQTCSLPPVYHLDATARAMELNDPATQSHANMVVSAMLVRTFHERQVGPLGDSQGYLERIGFPTAVALFVCDDE